MKRSKEVLAIFIFLFWSACTWDKAPLLVVDNGVCFETQILPIINSNCAISGCHDPITAEDGYDLSNYGGIMSIVEPGNPGGSKLMEVIRGSEDLMPPEPNSPLTSEQIDMIDEWIREGAPNIPGCGSVGPCDTSNIRYSITIAPIISTNCLGCHSNSGTGGGILLTTYNLVLDQVNSGKLWGSINHQSGYSPMPKNAAQLSNCDLEKINIWIEQGSPNN